MRSDSAISLRSPDPGNGIVGAHAGGPVVQVPSFRTDMEAIMTTPVTTVRRFYDALGRGDVPAILSLLDAQVEWTEAERFPYYSGTWRSPQAVLDNVLKPLAADWAGFSAKAHELIAE